MSAQAELFDIPSAATLVRQACDALYEGRSVVIVLPHPLSTDSVWERIANREPLRSERVVTSFPTAACQSLTPTHQLAEYFGAVSASLDSVLESPTLPDVLQLTQLDSLMPPDRKAWLDLVKSWSDATHRRTNAGMHKKSVIALLNSAEYLPPTDLFLERLYGTTPSPIELRLLCSRSIRRVDAASLLWREALLPELAGQDIELLDQLGELDDEAIADVDKVVDLLTAYGEGHSWVQELGALNGAILPEDVLVETLQQPWLSLWSKGILCRSGEHTWTFHSAILALQGKTDQLKHRLWRGQARMILPLLDDFRRSLCDLLSSRSPDWFTHIRRISSDGIAAQHLENAYDAEWSELAWPLEQCGRGIAAASNRARRIRNQIAHYDTVSFRDFLEFWRNRRIARTES